MSAESIAEVTGAFREWILGSRSLAPRTAEAYGRDVELYLKWFMDFSGAKTGGKLPPGFFETAPLRKYLAERLKERGISRRSYGRKVAAFKLLGEFLSETGAAKSNAAGAMKTPKQEKKLPLYVPKETVEFLLGIYEGAKTGGEKATETPAANAMASFPEAENGAYESGAKKLPPSLDAGTAIGTRNHVLFELLYSSGLRVSEAVALDLSDVHLNVRQAGVTGKGGKPRLIVFGDRAAELIRMYLAPGGAREELLKGAAKIGGENQKPAGGENALFLSKSGERLSVRQVQQALKTLREFAGIELALTPHKLRHAFATHLLEGGAGLRVIQQLLGHSDISTSEIYTRVSPAHLRKTYHAAHPHGDDGE